MLEELSVRDFALIDRLNISFKEGFTVLSGETGAGKSLLIGAIGFLLGAKADTSVIRTGSDEAMVIGIIDVSGSPDALKWLAGKDIEPEEGRISIRRGLKATGRGAVFIQNQPVLRQDLVELTSLLIDLHGQHEHQALLAAENHRRILDRYAGLEEDVAAFSESFGLLSQKRRAFEAALNSEKERLREAESLRFSIEEVRKAKLRRGEDAELESEERLLSQHERLFAAVENAHEGLSDPQDGDSVLSILRKVRSAMETAMSVDPTLADHARRLDDAYFELEDISDSLRHYKGSLRFSPERLEAVEARLSEIQKLKKKHGGGIEEILDGLLEDEERLSQLESWEEHREGLSAEIAALEAEIIEKALGLSERRAKAARGLQESIERVLKTLGMPRAHFHIRSLRKTSDAGKPVVGQFGMDEVEFLIAPNPGEAPRPLARIASGGELSRVALAAKTVLAETDTVSTLIFDEVDAGIGGEVAVSVGEHLAALGSKRQVLCITHLATIAARADNQYRVEKIVEGDRTSTRLTLMEGRARAEEIARMLAGDPDTEASVTHAIELLRKFGRRGEEWAR